MLKNGAKDIWGGLKKQYKFKIFFGKGSAERYPARRTLK
jgi:hypothetical protein